MTSWRPYPSPIRFVFAALPLLAIVVAGWLWARLGERAAGGAYDGRVFLYGLAFFLALVLAGVSAYLAWCAFTVGYQIDRRAIRIRCGGITYIVPLESVEEVYRPGESLGRQGPVQVEWARSTLPLPGYVVGVGRSPQVGKVLSVATAPAEQQIFIATPGVAFGISPENSGEFVRDLATKLRYYASTADEELGLEPEPILQRQVRALAQVRGWSGWGAPLWNDRLARWLLIVGLVLCILLFGYLSLVYQGLPQNTVLHWNAQAQPDRIGDPIELLRLPAFALAVWAVNAVVGWLVLSRERAATLFLLGGAAVAQLVFAFGALSIVLKSS